jgi:phosphoribosylamine---glycine ligase
VRVLVVGGGGREHALVWRLARNPTIDKLFAAPGNPGIARDAECVDVSADDVRGIVDLVERERIDLTVVGPEGPLVSGLADELSANGRLVFGPSRDAARLEGSKAWAKALCERHGIPAARSMTATTMTDALEALDAFEPPYVVKADGLAAGKGVVIAQERSIAVAALAAALEARVFGEAGSTVLIEEFLTGREVSAFALSDGRDVLPLGFAQDHKRAGDGDTGPNTGGMGAYSPVPFVDDELAERVRTDILERTVAAMAAEGTPYVGVVYAGLMLTADGPKVLEYNARFGDPETQVLMPRLGSDLAELALACAEGNLQAYRALLRPEACVTVVLASGRYPEPSETGFEISGLRDAADIDGGLVFHAGTAERHGRVVTAGGRVLSVSGTGGTIATARERAYEAVARISFEGMRHRTDIAARAAEEERA